MNASPLVIVKPVEASLLGPISEFAARDCVSRRRDSIELGGGRYVSSDVAGRVGERYVVGQGSVGQGRDVDVADGLGRRRDGSGSGNGGGGAAAAGDGVVVRVAHFRAGEGEAGRRRLGCVQVGVVGGDAVTAGRRLVEGCGGRGGWAGQAVGAGERDGVGQGSVRSATRRRCRSPAAWPK